MKVPFDKNEASKDYSLQDIIVPIRTDICPFCKSHKIELFSFNGYPQQYKYAVDEFIRGNKISYDKFEIRTMKCRSCNKEFVIDWIDGMPFPVYSTDRINKFLYDFIRGI